MVMVFDCETILDTALLKQGFKQHFLAHDIKSENLSELELSKKAMEIQKETARNARAVTNYMGADATVYDEIDASVTTEFVEHDEQNET